MNSDAAHNSPADEIDRRNAFGFLRLFFATLVVYSHAWFLAGPTKEPYASWLFNDAEFPGGIGVKCFFVISGFLVIRSERRSSNTRAFLWKRGLRIYPGLWVCLLVTGLLFPAISVFVMKMGAPDWGDALSYVWRNALQPRQQAGIEGMLPQIYYPGDLNGSLWTLPYEIGCYAVLGFIGWMGLTAGKARGAWVMGIGLFALYTHDLLRPGAAFFFKGGHRIIIGYFVVGALAGLLTDAKLRRLLSPVIVGLLAIAWIASWRLGGTPVIAPLALGAIALWCSWAIPIRSLETRLGGDYSYGLYIYGYPVQQMLSGSGLADYGIWWYFSISLIVTLGFAVVSWHLIEKRALGYKSRFDSR